MQQKSWILICFIGIALTIGLLVYGKSTKQMTNCAEINSVCCDTKSKKCPETHKVNVSGEMIIENLTRQFLIIPAY